MRYISIDTPILVVGRNACDGLRPYFDRIGYGGESVTYAETIGDGRVRAREHLPSIVVIDVDDQNVGARVAWLEELRAKSPALRIIALGDNACPCAHERLPWPVNEESFRHALSAAQLEYASATVAMRGDFKARQKPPTA